MATKEQIDALMENEAFVEKFKAANSPEEIVALYKEQGIDVSLENAKAGYDYMHDSGELDESALEDVSGGCMELMLGLATVAAAAAITAGVVAVGTAAAVGAAMAAPPEPPHHRGPHGGPYGGPHHGPRF